MREENERDLDDKLGLGLRGVVAEGDHRGGAKKTGRGGGEP